jgi:tRNA U38,U39,U40 pseudouridine synthase TruA
MDLIPALAEQFSHRICEVGNPFEAGDQFRAGFVCAGRADRVISAIGNVAKAVTRLGQP